MRFRILGGLEAEHDGQPLPLGRRKQRALLAILLIDANRVVSADRLIDELWQGAPPDDPAGALQVQVSRLRGVFNRAGLDGQAVLEAVRGGYVLHVGPDELDATRFEALVGEGRAVAATGHPEQAAALLAEALAVWRGKPLGDLDDEAFARAEVARLHEIRLGAFEDWVDAQLAGGHHAVVIGELQQAARSQPLRERLWGQLMVALYRCGRQAEALRAFAELRDHLGEELGIDPSPVLRRLEELILLQKPELDWTAIPPEAPRAASHAVQPRPPWLRGPGGEGPFVGRDEEIAELRAVWAAARTAGPALALVCGEPGIGKTELARRFARECDQAGATVLAGQCDEDLAVPYQPFAEALTGVLPDLAGAGLGALVGDSEGTAPTDPETARFRLFEAVAGALAELCRQAPLVLVADDVHWASVPTLLLLRHLITRAPTMPLLVVATYRDTETGDDHPRTHVLGETARRAYAIRITLAGLDPGEVTSLVAELAGARAGSPTLARTIHHHTGGNPMFVREIARHLGESAAADPPATVALPPSLRDAVGDRVARLSAPARQVLAVASVMGVEHEVAVLIAAADFDDETTVSALEEAVRSGLVTEAGGVPLRHRFTHGLVRTVLYDGLTAARRAQLHRRVGEAMEAEGNEEHLPALAHHFLQAAPLLGPAKGVAYAARAGDTALAQLAHDDAAHHFAAALDVLGDAPARRCDLLVSLGEAQRRAGDPGYRQTLLDAAALATELGDSERLARAALANTRQFWSATRGVDRDRVATLRAALDGLGPADGTLRARLLAKLAVELVYAGDAGTVRTLSDEAVAMARRLGDLPTLASVLAPRYNTIRGDPGTLAERLADTAELVTVAGLLGDPAARCEAWGWRAVAALEAGDGEEATAAFEVFDRLAAALRQPTMLWYSTYLRAARATLACRLDEAEQLATAAAALGRSAGHPDAERFLFAQRLAIADERGALGAWKGAVQAARAQDPAGSPFLHSWEALCAAEAGDLEEAAATLVLAWSAGLANLSFEPSWLHIMANWAMVCSQVGDAALAARLSAILDPYAGQVVTMASLAYRGAVDHHLGQLAAVGGEHGEACRRFEIASAIHRRIGAPGWLARTQVAHAASLAAEGYAERAAALAREAEAAATAHGLASVARAAAALRHPDRPPGGAVTDQRPARAAPA